MTYFPGSQCVLQDITSFHKRNNGEKAMHPSWRAVMHRSQPAWACNFRHIEGHKHRRMSLISPGDCQYLQRNWPVSLLPCHRTVSGGGLRGLIEKVIHVCKTSFDKDTILPQEATPEYLSGCPMLSLDRLRDFAVRMYRQLRKRHD